MSNNLHPLIADGLLLGLAILEAEDRQPLMDSTPVRELCVGFMAVAQQALGDACRTGGTRAADVLAEIRFKALGMTADSTFADAAATMWVAGFLEASRTNVEVFAAAIDPCFEHGVAGLAAVAKGLLVISARLHNISEKELIARYRASAVQVIASS